MADADFTSLLIHRCTIQRRDAAVEDELGHTVGDYADLETDVSCRLEPFLGDGRFVERTSDAKSLTGDHLLMLEPDQAIEQGDRITTVVYASGAGSVNPGVFSVLRVERGESDADEGLHHLEAQLDLISASDR